MKVSNLKEMIRELIEKEIDEMTGTGAVSGFATPYAFSGKGDPMGKKKKKGVFSRESVNEAVKREGFDQRAAEFLKRVQAKLATHSKKAFPDFRGNDTELSFTKGSKFWRIVAVSSGSRSAWGFLDTQTGDILKTAGWKTPAKGARGNIFDADYGISHLTPYGPEYLTGHHNYPFQEAVNEGGDPYYAWRNDETASPRMKIGKAISEINKQLHEVERVVGRSARLKKEMGVPNSGLGKRTNNAFLKMEARINRIAATVRNMRG